MVNAHQKRKPAVFLDRDGVINNAPIVDGTPTSVKSLDRLQILPRVNEALNILREAGFELVVVTNQPDVARGDLSRPVIESIHQQLRKELQIEHFYTCFHDDVDDCLCRKPKPGMLIVAAEDLDLDLRASFMVGDRWRDISAGQAAGCKNIFVDHSYSETKPQMPYIRVFSLFEAVHAIMEESHGTSRR